MLDRCDSVVRRALRDGADAAEAYAVHRQAGYVEARKGSVEAVSSVTSVGMALRVLVDNAAGFAYTTERDPASLRELSHRALGLARTATPNPPRGFVRPAPRGGRELSIYDPSAAEVSVDRLMELTQQAESAAYRHDSRIADTAIARSSYSKSHCAIASSVGVAAEYSVTLCSTLVSVIARDGDHAQRGAASSTVHATKDLDARSVGALAAERATASLGGKPIASRRAAIVLSPEAAAEMLQEVAKAMSGEAVARGRSFIAGHREAPLASRALTLVDDGAYPGGPATAPFDGEGWPTGRTVLISEGRTGGLLYHTDSAMRDGAWSTGNAVRTSFRLPPEVAPTNLMVEPGDRSLEELLALANTGLYVVTTRNVGGINPVSGDFSVGASGRLIENGRPTVAVSGVTIACPLPELLRQIQAVGSDVRWVAGQAATLTPSLLVDGVTIGGS